jgi:hypothetical protein
MTHDQISRIAYRLWQERGCPDGSPEVDWLRAQEVLQTDERTVDTGPHVEIESVEIESVAGLTRVDASESELGSEVPTLRTEVDDSVRRPLSRGAKSRGSRRTDSLQ